MKIAEVECKSMVSKSKLPDADYVINPYTGCNHGCVYCYAQFMRRFSGHVSDEWGAFMDVKRGGKIPGKLAGKSILIGSVTDPYNPLEKKYQATRAVLERLIEADTGAGIEILTKSPLVLRDIDLFKRIPGIRIGLSVSTMDEKLARLTEKHAAPPPRRLEAMRGLNAAGIPAYLFVSPIFPYLSGWEAVADAADGYVETIGFENLNLRANYRKETLQIIKDNYGGIYEEFNKVYTDKAYGEAYWNEEAERIRTHMDGRDYKIYFFHEKIKKR